MRRALGAYLLAIFVLIGPDAQAFEPSTLPEAAVITFDETVDPGSMSYPVGVFDGTLPMETVEGRLRQRAWRIPSPTLPTLSLIRGIRADLEAGGYEILLDCATEACGGFDFRFGLTVLPAPTMNADLFDFRVITARRSNAGVEEVVYVLASRGRSNRYLQVFEVLTSDASTMPVAPAGQTKSLLALSPLVSQLKATGHVVLADLDFATGAGALNDRSYGSLSALADYLNGNSARVVALVGHTDAVGSLEVNTALSRQRSSAVRDRLMTRYGVPGAQVLAQGAGFLAPVASNLTTAGREANRRVEAVLLAAE